MNDEQKIMQLYKDMYTAMINKDKTTLERIHDDSFVLIHMTGMRQDKKTYIRAIMDGMLNYYSAQTEDLQIDVHGDTAAITGKSRVTAAVFGSGKHTWRLKLSFNARKINNEWKLTKSEAATY